MEIMHQPSQRRIPADIGIYINYMTLILERVSCFFYNPINMINRKVLAKRISRGNKYHIAFGKRLKIRKMPQSGKGLPFPAAASFVTDSILSFVRARPRRFAYFCGCGIGISFGIGHL